MFTKSAKYYSVSDAALKLGLSRTTIRRYIGDGTLEATAIPRRTRKTYLVHKESVRQLEATLQSAAS